MLCWLGLPHGLSPLSGVPATLRVDNEKTAIASGAGGLGHDQPGTRFLSKPVTPARLDGALQDLVRIEFEKGREHPSGSLTANKGDVAEG